MAKKLAAVLLSMLLVLSLAACKSNTQDTSATDTNTQAVSENETESTVSVSEETTQAETEQAQGADGATSQQAETTTSAANVSSVNQTTTAKQTATTVKQNTNTTAKQNTTARQTAQTTAKQTTTKRQTTTATTKQTTTKKQTTTQKQTTKATTTSANYNVNSSNSNVKAVYNLVNQQRSNNGLSKLAYRNDLQSAANTRAKEIATKFSHTRPNGSTCFTAIKEAGASYSAAGENIGQTNGSNSDMMNWWMNSSEHRGNILSSKYTGIAIGCYEKDGYKYYVQIFIG